MKPSFCTYEHQRFSIRKYSFGAASVLLGASLVFGGQALADEQVAPMDSQSEQAQVLTTDQEAVAQDSEAQASAEEEKDLVVNQDQVSEATDTSAPVDGEITQTDQADGQADSQAQAETSVNTQPVETLSLTLNTASFSPVSQALDPSLLAESKLKVASQPASSAATALASQGTYTYTEQLEIKNEPKLSAKTEFFTKVGDTVNYDQVVTADGYQWISYKSYNGIRRYVPVQPQTTGGSTPGDKDLPAQGRYTLTADTDVKNSASASAPVEFTLDKGYAFNYDKVVEADGYKWLSYMSNSGTRRYVPVTKLAQATQSASTSQTDKDLPAQGRYTLTVDTDVKNSASASAPVEFTLDKGYAFNYDKVVEADGYKWLSYISFSGTRRYVPVTKLAQATQSASTSQTDKDLPAQGRYTLTADTDVKNSASASAPVEFTLDKGYAFNYDKVVEADGYKWLSYMSNSGTRRYVPVTKLAQATQSASTSQTDKDLPAQGRYTLTADTDVKNSASASAPVEFTLDKGYTVNYDKQVEADGYKWLSYISFSGTRRYLPISKVATASNQEKSAKGTISIQNHTNGDFTVVITDVEAPNGVKKVQVPVWTEKAGQDDIIWYDAKKQADGSYKVDVKLADHKNERGLYNVHLYYVENNNKTVGVATTQTTVAQKAAQTQSPTGTISIEKSSKDGFSVIVTDLSDAKGIKAVRVPVWTEKSGQDDIIWYEADKQSDGSYKVDVKLAKHKNETGLYNVHLYYVENNGKMVGVATSQTTIAAPSASTTDDSQATTGAIKLPNQGRYTFPDVTIIKLHPSASEPVNTRFGKGDSVYYEQVLEADGHQWLKFKGYDMVYYYADIAKLSNASNTSTNSSQSAKPASTELAQQGTYHFTKNTAVKNKPEQAAPTEFTFENGDSVNYDKTLEADGHQWISYLSFNGSRRYVDLGASTKASEETKAPSGTLSVTSQSNGDFTVIISDVKDQKGIKKVQVPVWTQKAGQDDIVWYDATKQSDGTYQAKVKLSEHKNERGLYNIHLYYTQADNSLVGVSTTTHTVADKQKEEKAAPSGQLSFKDQTDDRFTVVVSNVTDPEGVKAVKVPVWTENKGQDDIIWYEAAKQADGSYQVTVPKSDHKGESGLYNVHLYYVENSGKMVGVAATQTTMEKKAQETAEVTGRISVENKTATGFDVIISNVSDKNGLKFVEVPVWTENNGQDDLKWYTATKTTNGDYKVSVNIKDHKNETGDYNIHLYYVDQKGNMRGVATEMTNLSKPAETATSTETSQPSTAAKDYFAAQGHHGPVIIVNKKHALSETYQPGEDATAKAAFDKLRQAMKEEGLDVGQAYTGYVSYEEQANDYQATVDTLGQEKADQFLIRPGYDEHQTGLAFDLTNAEGRKLDAAAASNWLESHAAEYGFIVRYQPGKEGITGHIPEPGHLRYVGEEAKAIKASKLTLEEYFDVDGGDYGTPRADEGKNSQVKVTDTSASTATSQDNSSKPAKEETPAKASTTDKSNQSTTADKSDKATALAPQGSYTFKSEVDVKSQASQKAPVEYTLDAGYKVNYDKVIESEGRTWISYLSYSGSRRYVDVTAELGASKPAPSSSQAVKIPNQGSYTFTKEASIKSEPKISAPEIAHYNAGDSVNYDGVLEADGHQWISYLSYTGSRRYIAID